MPRIGSTRLQALRPADFAAELIAALSDAAELVIDANAHEVIAGWRATARIKAHKRLYTHAMTPDRG